MIRIRQGLRCVVYVADVVEKQCSRAERIKNAEAAE